MLPHLWTTKSYKNRQEALYPNLPGHGWNKRVALIIIFSFTLIIKASAQLIEEDTTTHQLFFKARKFNSRCFVDLDAMPGQILNTKAAFYAGAGLNWLINHHYVVTARYTNLSNPVSIQTIVAPDHPGEIDLKHQSAGLGFGYIVLPQKLFSFEPELTAGWGVIKYTIDSTTQSFRKDFAEIIPAIYGICNATKYFRVGIGLNYRICAGASLNGLKSTEIGGIGGLVFIRVGTF
jgi:hypothetical protein